MIIQWFHSQASTTIVIDTGETQETILWKSSCQRKHKFFFWLLLLDRLNTRNLLKRKCFTLASYECVFHGCISEETILHLFWDSPFAKACWPEISHVQVADNNLFEALASIQKDLKVPFAME